MQIRCSDAAERGDWKVVWLVFSPRQQWLVGVVALLRHLHQMGCPHFCSQFTSDCFFCLHHHLLRLSLSLLCLFLPAMLIYRFVAFAEVQTLACCDTLQTERSATLVRKLDLQKFVYWKWIFFGSLRHPHARTWFWRQLVGFNYTALCTEALRVLRGWMDWSHSSCSFAFSLLLFWLIYLLTSQSGGTRASTHIHQ